MKAKSLLLCLAFVALGLGAKAQNIPIDTDKATVKFTFVGENTDGTIGGIEASVNLDKDNLDNSSIKGSADVNTISTGNEKRDSHLKAADKFDAKKYPKIKFESTGLSLGDKDVYTMKGKMTIKGVTKEVTFKFRYDGKAFKGKTVIYTNDFGVHSQKKREDSKVVVSVNLPVK